MHQNTLEALIIFVPALFVFACYLSFPWAAGLGVAFIDCARDLRGLVHPGGREARSRRRAPGIVNIVLVLGGLWGLGKHLL